MGTLHLFPLPRLPIEASAVYTASRLGNGIIAYQPWLNAVTSRHGFLRSGFYFTLVRRR
jgi:hypothetical protein